MKLVKNEYSSEYGSSSLDFGMVRKTAEDSIELVLSPKPCRDYLHDVIRCQLHKGKDWYSGYDHEKHKEVDLDMFRLVLYTKEDNTSRVELAVKAINLLESEMRIEPQMTFSKLEAWKNGASFLLEGDKVWISDPHLMSIISLVTRWVILRATELPENIDSLDIDSLLEWFKNGAKGNTSTDNTSYMPSFIKKAKLILQNHQQIFKLPLEEAYPNFKRFTRDDYHSKGGIHELCNYNSGMHELETVIKALEKVNG